MPDVTSQLVVFFPGKKASERARRQSDDSQTMAEEREGEGEGDVYWVSEIGHALIKSVEIEYTWPHTVAGGETVLIPHSIKHEYDEEVGEMVDTTGTTLEGVRETRKLYEELFMGTPSSNRTPPPPAVGLGKKALKKQKQKNWGR